MRRKLWIITLCLVLTFIIKAILFTNNRTEITDITATYSEETDQIIVYVTRPSKRNEPYEYENRAETRKIVSLSNYYSEDGTDIFTFDILENGSAELVFLTNDPQYEQKEYAYGYGLKVAISDTFINLDNRLWRRKES